MCTNAEPCKCCLRGVKSKGQVIIPKGTISYPIVKKIQDLYYAQCPKCNHFDPYEFLGTTERNAINSWNSMMKSSI